MTMAASALRALDVCSNLNKDQGHGSRRKTELCASAFWRCAVAVPLRPEWSIPRMPWSRRMLSLLLGTLGHGSPFMTRHA